MPPKQSSSRRWENWKACAWASACGSDKPAGCAWLARPTKSSSSCRMATFHTLCARSMFSFSAWSSSEALRFRKRRESGSVSSASKAERHGSLRGEERSSCI
jgi:hypothetical protein